MSWPLVKLNDVAPAKPLKLANVEAEDDIWQITLDHIESNTGRLLERSKKSFSEAGSSTHAFDERYVLYSKLRPYLNKVLLPDGIGVGTTELVPMLPDAEKLDRKYLAYYLRSEGFLNWVSNQTAGAKMPRVSMKVFWEHEIPLPPLPEQKRIAAILDKADQLRQKRQQAIGLADEFLRSVFLEMFGDPVTNPKGWETTAISNLINQSRGVTYGIVQRGKQVDGGVPVVRISDFASNMFEPLNVVSCEPSISKKYSRTVLEGNELVISIRGTVGRVALIPKTAIGWNISREVAIIPTTDQVSRIFLKQLLLCNPVQRQLAGQIKGVAQSGLNLADLRKFQVIRPSEELIKKFEAAEELVHKRYLNSNVGDNLSDLFNSLSQKAFAGEL